MAHGRGCGELLAPRNRSPYLRGAREEGPGLLCAAPESPSAAGHRDGAGQGCGGGRLGAEAGRGAAALPAGGHGSVRLGTARYGSIRLGMARYSPVWHGTARYGPVRHGTARYGTARQPPSSRHTRPSPVQRLLRSGMRPGTADACTSQPQYGPSALPNAPLARPLHAPYPPVGPAQHQYTPVFLPQDPKAP